MNIGVLGTGSVGEGIASALVSKGHNVRMGARSATNERAAAWVDRSNDHATQGDFYDAAAFGDLVFLCLNGAHALDVVRSLPPDATEGKIIVDITNPLDFSKGMPPAIMEEYREVSLGERIQEAVPNAHVVKTLNTVNYKLMVNAREVNGGRHSLFICGDSSDAKNKVKHFLVDNFHWRADHILDLGGIQAVRSVEAIVPFWVLVYQSLGTPLFNFDIVH